MMCSYPAMSSALLRGRYIPLFALLSSVAITLLPSPAHINSSSRLITSNGTYWCAGQNLHHRGAHNAVRLQQCDELLQFHILSRGKEAHCCSF
mmetsp:Transcript_66620/g.148692  ORF Transcript_66620/g.148692 Transcript_66620/m.148692 type:complete len:93 (-) Transcript_66620:206-484(-)